MARMEARRKTKKRKRWIQLQQGQQGNKYITHTTTITKSRTDSEYRMSELLLLTGLLNSYTSLHPECRSGDSEERRRRARET